MPRAARGRTTHRPRCRSSLPGWSMRPGRGPSSTRRPRWGTDRAAPCSPPPPEAAARGSARRTSRQSNGRSACRSNSSSLGSRMLPPTPSQTRPPGAGKPARPPLHGLRASRNLGWSPRRGRSIGRAPSTALCSTAHCRPPRRSRKLCLGSARTRLPTPAAKGPCPIAASAMCPRAAAAARKAHRRSPRRGSRGGPARPASRRRRPNPTRGRCTRGPGPRRALRGGRRGQPNGRRASARRSSRKPGSVRSPAA
mmetsp:Transcript_37205/g.107170  ORF Transcript_37205/g.107170 Transcript_37205/m.107170 type:complete len:253 (+) Transcript_37205:802-1560(+)